MHRAKLKIRELYDAVPPGLARACQFALDIAVLAGAFALAYLLRFDFVVPRHELGAAERQLLVVVSLQAFVLAAWGVHRILWRYVTLRDAQRIAAAICLSALICFGARLILPEAYAKWRVPLTVTTMDVALALCGIVGMRCIRRVLHEAGRRSATELAGGTVQPLKRVILLGAGHVGRLATEEIARRQSGSLRIIGFVDDDPRKRGTVVNGVRVLGSTADLPLLVRAFEVDQVVITIGHASRADLRRLVELCDRVPVMARVMPGLYELLQGKVSVNRIREVNITELLGRPPVNLDKTACREFIAGKRVMVSGAGGSIGSELARQVAGLEPEGLILVERSEFALFTIHCELKDAFPDLRIAAVLADVGDACRMRHVFMKHRPHVVVHAAAHKHVPLIEDNPTECVTNNVLATNVFGTLAGEFGAEAFVLISTDKAVRPTSLMGASKRVTEIVIQALNQRYATRYVAVRFGNVIGSAGSVIPIFLQQIREGGPITVTHPGMVRYFMTIPEASELVLEGATMGRGGEIFVLDMGEPVRIVDLARDLIVLSDFEPYKDIDIVFTGIRPGEKLFEELQLSEEGMDKTRHPKIFTGRIAARPYAEVERVLRTLEGLASAGNDWELRCALSDVIPESHLLDKTAAAVGYAVAAASGNATV